MAEWDLVDPVLAAASWLGTRPGIATLEFLGGLLIGQEVLAISFGEERVKQLAERLHRVGEALAPANLASLMTRVMSRAVGPALAWSLFAAAAIVAVFESVEAFRAGPYGSAPDSGLAGLLYRFRTWLTPTDRPLLPFNDPALLLLIIVELIILIPIPVMLFSAGHAVRTRYLATRSGAVATGPAVAPPWRTRQTTRNTPFSSAAPFSDLIASVAQWVSALAAYLGTLVGQLLFTVTVAAMRFLLALLAALVVGPRLRRIGVIMGLGMITLAYVLKLLEPSPI